LCAGSSSISIRSRCSVSAMLPPMWPEMGRMSGIRGTGKELIKRVADRRNEGLSPALRNDRGGGTQRHTLRRALMASANDMEAAQKTYSGFVNLWKWVVPITAALAFIVILLIS